MPRRNVTAEPLDPREQFSLYRLCDCPTCEGRGQVGDGVWIPAKKAPYERCPDCRGEGRIRQELASCETPEAVGVALVTLAREGEWEDCPVGLLDRMPECSICFGKGLIYPVAEGYADPNDVFCTSCQGSGVKPTGTWLILPWTPSARNVRDAARTLARSKKTSR